MKYALLILHETRNKLRDFPNVRRTTTSITNQITICGKMVLMPKVPNIGLHWQKTNVVPCTEIYSDCKWYTIITNLAPMQASTDTVSAGVRGSRH